MNKIRSDIGNTNMGMSTCTWIRYGISVMQHGNEYMDLVWQICTGNMGMSTNIWYGISVMQHGNEYMGVSVLATWE